MDDSADHGWTRGTDRAAKYEVNEIVSKLLNMCPFKALHASIYFPSLCSLFWIVSMYDIMKEYVQYPY